MRPVEKGEAPGAFGSYRDAFPHLRDRIGAYCNYCERRLPTNLAIEHIVPKSLDLNLREDWENFLLACTNCNSVKSDKPVVTSRFLWPDRDDTHLAFAYQVGGFVEIADNLDGSVRGLAIALLDLVGLDRHGGSTSGNQPTRADERWSQREEIWALAGKYRGRLLNYDSTAVREAITDLAIQSGFFSVWHTVFRDDSDMRLRFIAGFKGTSTGAYDGDGAPITRGG